MSSSENYYEDDDVDDSKMTIKKRKKESPFEGLSRDSIAEVLSWFDKPDEWLSLQTTSKIVFDDTHHKETAWGMENAEFCLDPNNVMKLISKIPLNHVRNLTLDVRKRCKYPLPFEEFFYILAKLCPLTTINLTFDTAITDAEKLSAIANGFANLKWLESISLNTLDFNERKVVYPNCELEWLIDKIRQSKKLTTLQLHGMGFNHLKMHALARALAECPRIECLDLFDRGVRGRGWIRIAEYLATNVTVRELYVQTCYRNSTDMHFHSYVPISAIEDRAMSAFAEMLKLNRTLRTCVIMAYCGPVGCLELLESLRKNKSLTRVGLVLPRNNNVRREDITQALAKVIVENETLLEIWICGDDMINDRTVEILSGTIKKNTTLRSLTLSPSIRDMQRHISIVGVKAIIEGMRINKKISVCVTPWLNDADLAWVVDVQNEELNDRLKIFYPHVI